jgi:hypothetical protein
MLTAMLRLLFALVFIVQSHVQASKISLYHLKQFQDYAWPSVLVSLGQDRWRNNLLLDETYGLQVVLVSGKMAAHLAVSVLLYLFLLI